MDLLHSWGVELAVYLQTSYSGYQDIFSVASTVADLHTTFFFFFPVWFHLRRDAALRLIWVAVLGDWINLVLKWVLFGERPYWWVQETRFYGAGPRPGLQQFPITCETGPGSPSGHAMGASAVWYVMVTALLSAAAERRCPPLLFNFLRMFLWVLMGLVLLLVCMSRVFMAAHFPHQVIAGLLSGVLVAEVVSRQKWIYGASLRNYVCTTLFLTSFAIGFYLLLKAVGVDLLWTMEKAQRWCVRPEWVHLDTTPFASLLRNMGTLLGLGLGLQLGLGLGLQLGLGLGLGLQLPQSGGVSSKAGRITASLLLLQLLDGWTFSSEDLLTFYFLSFAKSAIALLIPTLLVPWALCCVFERNTRSKDL